MILESLDRNIFSGDLSLTMYIKSSHHLMRKILFILIPFYMILSFSCNLVVIMFSTVY